MDETIPIPVMTTRLMSSRPFVASLLVGRHWTALPYRHAASGPRLRCGARLEQADLQILGAIDNLAVGGKPPVGNAQHQLSPHHPLNVDMVHDLANVRQHLAGKLQLPKT